MLLGLASLSVRLYALGGKSKGDMRPNVCFLDIFWLTCFFFSLGKRAVWNTELPHPWGTWANVVTWVASALARVCVCVCTHNAPPTHMVLCRACFWLGASGQLKKVAIWHKASGWVWAGRTCWGGLGWGQAGDKTQSSMTILCSLGRQQTNPGCMQYIAEGMLYFSKET